MASTSLPFQEHHQPDIPSKVKVTILASEWGSSKGGLSTLNRELAIQLAKFPEVEITFFLPRCSEEDKKEALKHNVKVVDALPRPGFIELDWLCFPPKHLQLDIVVGHGVKLGHQAQVIRENKDCKWVQMVHTDPEELGVFKNYDKPISKGEEKHKTELKLCEMADLVIGVGPKLSEAFRSYLRGFQEVKCVHDFTPGVFDEFVSAKQSHDEQKHCSVLVFGRGDDEDFELKGFDIAGRAISKLPDTRLVFAGAPVGKHEEIARRLSECGVPKRCLRVRRFVQSREELKRLFQEVDLVLMPSRTEGFGLTGLEALSAGLPVLVSRNSGFGEALYKVPFGSSFVIDSEDPEEWASAIKEVWNKDRQGRLAEAEILRTSYGKKYNWAKQSRDLLDKMISIVHGASDAKTDLQQLVAGTESAVKENGKRLKLDHCQAGQGVMPLAAGLQRSQSASQISREFAYCEADITFFAARHDEDTRQWLFKDFDKWFSDPGDSTAYVLLGDAGIGKSVIAGALTQRARNNGHLGAAYFCRHNDGTRNNPRYLVGTIARQLCDCNSEISTLVGGEGGVKMMLANSKLGVKELFTKLLEEPLGKCTPCQQRKLVIIDALDETEYESREDFLYIIKKALPRLPQWLLFFITSRPEDSVQSRLEKYKPCIRICAGHSEERSFYKQHEQDIKLFLKKEIDFSYISYSVEQVTRKCNGLFLYAYYIAEVLKESNSHRVSQQTDLFPGDIDEFFEENFQRVFDKVGADLYRKLFGCIIAAPSPLPISFVSYVLNKEMSDLDEQEAIDAVSLFVVRTSDGTVTFLHNLIPMWLTDKRKAPRRLLIDKKVAVEYLRIVFIEILSFVVEETRATLPLRDEDLESFVMHFAVPFQCHHVDQNSLTNVFNWLTNYRLLEKRIHSGRSEIYHVIEDFKLASSCLPAEETQQQNVLQEISLALEKDFHVLVECPHLLRSCDGVSEILSIPQVSAPCLECMDVCNISIAKFRYVCFATTSDNKTKAAAKSYDVMRLKELIGQISDCSPDLKPLDDSFKRDVGFLDLVGNNISHRLSPRKMWMVNSREKGEIHLLRTNSCLYGSQGREYRITQAKYLTFTHDDLYFVYLSGEGSLHALSLQEGTVFKSVSGLDCFYFTRPRQFGYLFSSGTEERAIFLTSLLNSSKFHPVLSKQEVDFGEMAAAIFSSSHTVKSVSSKSLIFSWRLVGHNSGFSFKPIFEPRSTGSPSHVIEIQNCVFSIDGKLLAFQQHTQIKQCHVEVFEKSLCTVFEADLNFTDLCLTFSSDSVFLLFSIQDDFYVWDVKRKALSKSFSSPGLATIDSFCISSDNRNLILCGGECEIEIWEFNKYPCRLLQRIGVERSCNPVKFSQCAVSQDRELFVCCLANVIFVHSLQVADISSSKRVLRGHLGKIEFCKFLKRNRYLISYAVDGMVFLWDIAESKSVAFARIAKERERILCMAVSPDEDWAVCFISPSRVCVLNFFNLKCALPADFFKAPRKGGISTAETSVLPFGQISSRTNIPAVWLENIQPGGFSNPDLEEQFLLTRDDFLDSDESDDCVNYDDFD